MLQRSLKFEETVRALSPLQHRFAGLLQDAFNDPKLRETVDLSEGKTPFRDANDLIAKTHGLRAYEASGRTKIAAAMTPARASDPERDENIVVGQTKLPLLGALQAKGTLHPTKLSSALNMLEQLDKEAESAGKDQNFRQRLRTVIEKDLASKIEHTTPEEFGRYVGRRKKDVLASIDPPDKNFTPRQTEAMHNVWCEGPVRGNPDAYKWSIIVDAEGNEVLSTVESLANNPRAKDEDDDFDSRTRGQRSMHAIRDALKFALANIENSNLRGSSGAHSQVVVLADYPTLMQHLRTELAELLPDITAVKREQLLAYLAEAELANTSAESAVDDEGEGAEIVFPPPKTTNLNEVLNDENLDRLQPRISQGIYTPYIPPDTILRMMCNVSVSPVTLTGQRQVLSIGRKQRQFTEAIRRAILARDRGCAVPGCHWPAAWCELHHITYWSNNGETSTENGLMMCSHHHKALHANMLQIERVNGEVRFKLHPLIDPAQEPRQNYFWQN
ncbi:MAG: HNH endonuclease [Yaniella sp.]|nr:HNH endonuclease [Yaniella sp.]